MDSTLVTIVCQGVTFTLPRAVATKSPFLAVCFANEDAVELEIDPRDFANAVGALYGSRWPSPSALVRNYLMLPSNLVVSLTAVESSSLSEELVEVSVAYGLRPTESRVARRFLSPYETKLSESHGKLALFRGHIYYLSLTHVYGTTGCTLIKNDCYLTEHRRFEFIGPGWVAANVDAQLVVLNEGLHLILPLVLDKNGWEGILLSIEVDDEHGTFTTHERARWPVDMDGPLDMTQVPSTSKVKQSVCLHTLLGNVVIGHNYTIRQKPASAPPSYAPFIWVGQEMNTLY